MHPCDLHPLWSEFSQDAGAGQKDRAIGGRGDSAGGGCGADHGGCRTDRDAVGDVGGGSADASDIPDPAAMPYAAQEVKYRKREGAQ